MAVNQHMGTQPTLIPPRISTGPTNLQPPAKTLPSQVPSNIQRQQLPFVDTPPAPTQNSFVENTASPSLCDTRSKSKNGQGVKQTSSTSSFTSTSMEKSEPICWNCREAGHLKHNCPNPPYCSKCKEKGHLPVKCPIKARGRKHLKHHKDHNKHQWTRGFPTSETNASTVEVIMCQERAPPGRNLKQLQALWVTWRIRVIPVQVRLMIMFLLTGTQGHASGTHAPQITPQVSPNTSQQQNSYIHNNIPPMQIPNQFPPPPYFPIPFPPPPIAPSNVSNAPSAPVSDISVAITLMTNAVTQGNSNMTAITNALERTTTQFADALQQTIQMGVDAQAQENKNARLDKQFDKVKVFDGANHLNVTHGWKRYMPCVPKQEGPSMKCCYYVQVRLFVTSSQTCPLMQRMIKSRMTSSQGTWIYKD